MSEELSRLSSEELLAELIKRERWRLNDCCDYCGGDYSMPVCEYPERHKSAIKPVEQGSVNDGKCPSCERFLDFCICE